MAYKKIKCHICNAEISSGGLAYSAHMKSHVRKGQAIMSKDINGKTIYEDTSKVPEYKEPEPYAKLGNKHEKWQSNDTWDITENLEELGDGVNPQDYFVTSGEAIKKAEKMVKDLYSLAVKARVFKDKLIKAKDKARYLETHRENGRLLIKQKSPKNKKPRENNEKT